MYRTKYIFLMAFCVALMSCTAKDVIEKNVPQTQEVQKTEVSYFMALTDEEKSETKDIISDYFTDVKAVRIADDDDPFYSNDGIEGEYSERNIIIYYVMTETIMENGDPEMRISIARENETAPWKVINQGY